MPGNNANVLLENAACRGIISSFPSVLFLSSTIHLPLMLTFSLLFITNNALKMIIITQRQNNNGPTLKRRKRIRSFIHLCVNSSHFCLVRYVNQETGSGREGELKGIMYKLLFACKQSLNNFPPFKWHYNWGDPSHSFITSAHSTSVQRPFLKVPKTLHCGLLNCTYT